MKISRNVSATTNDIKQNQILQHSAMIHDTQHHQYLTTPEFPAAKWIKTMAKSAQSMKKGKLRIARKILQALQRQVDAQSSRF